MGVGGTPSYKPYSHVPLKRVGFLRHFSLKTGIHFAHFGLELGMVYKRNYGCVSICSSFQFLMSKKESVICEFEMDFQEIFLLQF